LQEKGIKAIYGDATEEEILNYADIGTAAYLIVTLPNLFETERIILTAKRLNPNLKVITRSHLDKHLRHLKTLGIEYIIQPES
jgi:voltage-gated potassium channel Kch